MTTLTPVTDQDVLIAWGVAELRGAAGTRAVALGLLTAQVLDGLQSGDPDALSADGWAQVIAAIQHKRAPLIGNLFTLGIEWTRTTFDVAQLQAMEIIAVPEWHAKYPSHRMDELAGPRDLARTGPEFRGFETVIECPIAVGATLDGLFCLVEGYTRVAAFLHDAHGGLTKPGDIAVPTMPMLLGVSSRIHEWEGPKGWRWWP